jgi:Asp-tRNA(Asn)/Glu-tRNA(Gln) amidotransferase C subunit
MARITQDTVRQLAVATGIRPADDELAPLADALDAILTAVDRCEELGLDQHEPATGFRLTGGAPDAEF